jgi:hypothetical protein
MLLRPRDSLYMRDHQLSSSDADNMIAPWGWLVKRTVPPRFAVPAVSTHWHACCRAFLPMFCRKCFMGIVVRQWCGEKFGLNLKVKADLDLTLTSFKSPGNCMPHNSNQRLGAWTKPQSPCHICGNIACGLPFQNTPFFFLHIAVDTKEVPDFDR